MIEDLRIGKDLVDARFLNGRNEKILPTALPRRSDVVFTFVASAEELVYS